MLEGKTKPGAIYDCTVRAIANAYDLPYDSAERFMEMLGRKPDKTFLFEPLADILDAQELTGFYTGQTMRTVLRFIQNGIYIVLVRRHVFAVRNGVIHDTGQFVNYRVKRLWKVGG